jgi:hypothetical protein
VVGSIAAYVEADARMAADHATVAWAFDLDLWGRCGQGTDEESALAALATEVGGGVRLDVVERVTGDERAFPRDERPATGDERTATLAILADVRRDTLALVTGSPPEVLDFDDPQRSLPAWATWRTLRQMAWHVVNTESRYYLPRLGLPYREAEPDLVAELHASADHVRHAVATMPADLVNHHGGETWTTTKVLRRLAWHERSELVTMHHLARRATGSPMSREEALEMRGSDSMGAVPADRPPSGGTE